MTEMTSSCPPPTDPLFPIWLSRGGLIVLAGILLINLPIFLCQHLTPDTIIFDFQAKTVLAGGVLYRDIVEPNLPGVVAIHIAVRSIAGWSSIAMRAFDLLVLAAILFLLSGLVFGKDQIRKMQKTALFCFFVLFFYMGQTEWCHCQRDTWLLCPSLIAVLLRRNRVIAQSRTSSSAWYQSSLVEGFVWGLAFWIKPHVAFPALMVILISWFEMRELKRIARDAIGVVLGGVLAGVVGVALIILNGAWEPFWIMQLEWNPEYVKVGRQNFTLERFVRLYRRLLPWSWIHVGAILVSIKSFQHGRFDFGRNNLENGEEGEHSRRVFAQRLLVGLYVGWMAQALLLQHPFEYIQVPGLILAIAIVASLDWSPKYVLATRFVLILFAAAALPASPLTSPMRVRQVGNCLTSGSTFEVRSQIQLQTYPNWNELKPILEYLKSQEVQGEDVTVYPGTLIHVYRELDLKPTTRYIYLDVLARIFADRADEIHEALSQANHRFVVSGLREAGMSRDRIEGEQDPQTLLPVDFPKSALNQFPYTQPVVFRSGQYLVHRVENPIGEMCTKPFPLAQPEQNVD